MGGGFLPKSLQILWCCGSRMTQVPDLRLSLLEELDLATKPPPSPLLFWWLYTYLNYLFWKTVPRPPGASSLPLPLAIFCSAMAFFFQAWKSLGALQCPPDDRSPRGDGLGKPLELLAVKGQAGLAAVFLLIFPSTHRLCIISMAHPMGRLLSSTRGGVCPPLSIG